MPLRSPLYCLLLPRWNSPANPPGSTSGGRARQTVGSASALSVLTGSLNSRSRSGGPLALGSAADSW
eukprot:8245693-Alexandrium_andersonii.AAC.1